MYGREGGGRAAGPNPGVSHAPPALHMGEATCERDAACPISTG